MVLRSKNLLRGLATHRWERYVVPTGKTVQEMDRDVNFRLVGEVPGDGNVLHHQLHQERLIRTYAPLDVGSASLLKEGYVRRHPAESKKTGDFEKSKPLGLRDIVSLRVAALTHDLGEIEHADTVWDLKHLSKHTAQDEIEATKRFVHRAIVEKDPRRARRFERRIMAEYAIDHDQNHRLYGLFKLYEKYSYMEGAIMAYDKGRGAVAHSHWLVHNVLKNQIVPLIAAGEAKIPSAMRFLCERVETITAMFSWVANSGFRDQDEASQRAHEDARKAWGGYLRKNPVSSTSSKNCKNSECREFCDD